eukprot:scaffold70_cov242-Pinguiococcus_pyrenoidosus.AAC.7
MHSAVAELASTCTRPSSTLASVGTASLGRDGRHAGFLYPSTSLSMLSVNLALSAVPKAQARLGQLLKLDRRAQKANPHSRNPIALLTQMPVFSKLRRLICLKSGYQVCSGCSGNHRSRRQGHTPQAAS